ncbi:excisionase family DNA binding protein [Agromyces hippuratus]|uniref:Excisionase family DNA binding protein n=1 Tax=Agromyces hippuratus TaxID=286438 RepID=A0A852WVG7_9MICO|nr:helix-turn-helix domain-containing protein [Agromyces hippuratus]NYG22056.1 excisionase family DNA binding protein [Agromyces hippuratus]
MEKLMLTPEEVADALGIGRSTVYDLMRLNAIASVKIGRSRRIPVIAVREYAERLTQASTVR